MQAPEKSPREPPVRVTLSQRRRLQDLATADGTPSRVRCRALIVLMSAAGVSGAAIATALGITRRTVSTARTRWNRGGLGALSDGHSPGRPPKADAGYVARLLWVVERDPRDLGYAFTRWTAPRLAAYLRSQTGIEVSAAWVSQLLRSRHYVWRRTKLTIRNLQDPAAVKRARRALSTLKKKPRSAGPASSCGSATA